jgi:16S rRNA (cytosine967-C5)-methyltransferase
MPRPIHLKQSAELLDTILSNPVPADKQMEGYFRAHKNMGVRDRGEVAEIVYACLRQRRLLEHIAQSSRAIDIVAALLLQNGISGRALAEHGIPGDVGALAARVRTFQPDSAPLPIRASLPDWLAERLVAQFGTDETARLGHALNQAAPVDLRVNTLKVKREQAIERLQSEGFACEPTPYSPVGLRLKQRATIFRSASFHDGWIEVQDEGSQLISLLLEPRRGEMVVDFCAGAGGKTLHLGALMANSGTLYAFDVSGPRLERLAPRVRRAGLSNVRTVVIDNERDARVQRLYGKVDRVLIDAPCSGTGTLRRNPDIKWRNVNIAALVDTQRRIVAAAAPLLKPGGRLVYATCSLFAEENDAIVEGLLAEENGISLLPVNEILSRKHISLESPDPVLRLLPHRHGTDGFYCAVLTRTT